MGCRTLCAISSPLLSCGIRTFLPLTPAFSLQSLRFLDSRFLFQRRVLFSFVPSPGVVQEGVGGARCIVSETEGGKVQLGPIRRCETCPTSADPTVQTGPPGGGTALSGGGNREPAKTDFVSYCCCCRGQNSHKNFLR